jgi:hypothetical protein
MPRRVVNILTYLVQHDAHHRGQICFLARDLGHKFRSEDTMRMWGWKALPPLRWSKITRSPSRECGGTATPLTSIFTPGWNDEPPQLSYGGGGRTSHFVCGYLNCDQRFNPLVDALPTMLLVRSRDDCAAIEAIDARGTRPTVVPEGSGNRLDRRSACTGGCGGAMKIISNTCFVPPDATFT